MAINNAARMRLVIVEDNPPDVLLVEESLKNLGIDHELTHFSDGHKALEALKNGFLQKLQPHAVVLDLNVPKINGMEVLERLKEDESLKSVPVIVLTSSMAPDERETARRLGAALYVRKPVDLDDFLKEVGNALRAVVYGGSGC